MRTVFGEYSHVYDTQPAKEHGATVANFFESRLAKLSLKAHELPYIDAEVDELAEDEEETFATRVAVAFRYALTALKFAQGTRVPGRCTPV